MPVFVKVDEYEDVLNLIRSVRSKVEDAKDLLVKIDDVKKDEDNQLQHWKNTLNEIEKKIDFVDHSLNEPEHY